MPRPPAKAPADARSGMALILALAAIALAGGLAFWMQARSLAARREAQRAVLLERLRAAAAEAVRAAMLALREDPDPAVDSPADAWAAPQAWTTGDGIAVRTVTEDAGRWFDWNNKMKAVYKRGQHRETGKYLDHRGMPQEIGYWTCEDMHIGTQPIAPTCYVALQLMVYYRYLPTGQKNAWKVSEEKEEKVSGAAKDDVEVSIDI